MKEWTYPLLGATVALTTLSLAASGNQNISVDQLNKKINVWFQLRFPLVRELFISFTLGKVWINPEEGGYGFSSPDGKTETLFLLLFFFFFFCLSKSIDESRLFPTKLNKDFSKEFFFYRRGSKSSFQLGLKLQKKLIFSFFYAFHHKFDENEYFF